MGGFKALGLFVGFEKAAWVFNVGPNASVSPDP